MPALLLYSIPYIAFFVIALKMPGRRSLLALVILLGLPLGWLVFQGFQSAAEAPGGAGFFALLATTFVLAATVGLFSGAAARAVALWIPRIGRSRVRSAVLVVTALLAAPAFVAGSAWWSKWKVRAPDEACLAMKHHVVIAEADLWLPSAPVFTPWLGEKELYPFSSNQGLRAFCDISRESSKPVRIVNLSIHAKELSVEKDPLRRGFCAAGARNLARLLCGRKAPTAHSSEGFAEQLSVYSSIDYDHRRMLVSDRGAYAGFIKERDAATANGKPLQASDTDDFSRYANGYWIARDASWKNDAGERYTLYCYDTPPKGMLYCKTTYRSSYGPHVTYRFRAHRDELAPVARTIDANFHVLMNILTTR